MSETDLAKEIRRLEKQMLEHARNLEFEQAGQVRDQLRLLKEKLFGMAAGELPGIPAQAPPAAKPVPGRLGQKARSRAVGRSMVRILFVCSGNICRSPTAEGVLGHAVLQAGLHDHVEIASAGTHDYHVGECPDRRGDRGCACARIRRVLAEGAALQRA